MATPLLTVENLYKSFGGVIATDAVDLNVESGEIHAVIGPNGAGKTTLVAQLSGELQPDAGTIGFEGRSITKLAPHARARLGIARSFQITSLMLDMSVRDNVALAVQ
ncbi:MAG: ATP-binding cassette domain-containing protein, partial [Alphaproteobacteria bacterium]|nr:ATP-binding cassette domain-containing protein [Alphaproteobacteria bacterium]